MHKIQDRPMVVAGKIEVRPMMYLALSYDHRIVDGREAVTFLVRVKEGVEDPRRLVVGAMILHRHPFRCLYLRRHRHRRRPGGYVCAFRAHNSA